jgi:hypothetical protein
MGGMNMGKRIIKYSLLILIVLFAALAYAEETKYPPYPDVWGYEFPWPAENDIFSHIRKARMDNGDFLIAYINKVNKQKIKRDIKFIFENRGVYFFAGKEIRFTVQESNKFWDQYIKKHKNNQRDDRVIFSDKSVIKRVSKDYGRPDADRQLRTYIVKEDKDGNIIWTKNILYMPVKPLRKEVRHDPVDDRNNSLKSKYLTQRVVDVFPIFVPLQDDTFLFYDMEGNFIIRLDKDMKTKSNLMNNRIFLIDSEIAEKIEDKLTDNEKYNDQTINNALYEYIQSNRKEAGK